MRLTEEKLLGSSCPYPTHLFNLPFPHFYCLFSSPLIYVGCCFYFPLASSHYSKHHFHKHNSLMLVMSFPGLGIFQGLPTVYHSKFKFISSVVKTFIKSVWVFYYLSGMGQSQRSPGLPLCFKDGETEAHSRQVTGPGKMGTEAGCRFPGCLPSSPA